MRIYVIYCWFIGLPVASIASAAGMIDVGFVSSLYGSNSIFGAGSYSLQSLMAVIASLNDDIISLSTTSYF